LFERRVPAEIREGESSLAAWQGSDSTTASKVLQMIARAFAWREEDAQRLRPDDKLCAIYRSYYPQKHWWQRFKPDELEMETLHRDLEREVPGCGAELDRDAGTVGDLVPRLSL